MSQRSRVTGSIIQAAVIAVVVLALTSGLEYLGVTNQGYGFAVAFSLVFALTWGAIRVIRERRR